MQGKRILLVAFSGFAALAITHSAFATMSLPEGWYVDANAGSTQLTKKSYPGSPSSSGIGGNVAIGYKFMPYVGAEVGYTRYANTSIKDSIGTAGSDRHYSYDIAGKGFLPLGQTGAELFAKLGVGRNNSSLSIANGNAASAIGLTSSSHTKTGFYVAAGAQYDFMPELAGTVEWATAQGNSATGTMSLLSVGLSYIFG